MNALVMMLRNTRTEEWHPIIYTEKPLPGPPEENKVVRLKSMGHRTHGLKTREEALETIETEFIARVPEWNVRRELDEDLLWDGCEIPADVQIREASYFTKTETR